MALPTPPITTLTMTGVTSYRVTPAALITVAPELPKSCATSWVFEIGNDGYVLQNFDYITDFEKCLPLPLASRGTEYSPGICRSGLEIKTVTQILEVLDDGLTTETNWKAFCCSSDFTVAERAYSSSCVASLDPPFTALLSVPSEGFVPTRLTTDVIAVSDPFVVYWRESDLSIFPTEARRSLENVMGITPEPTADFSGGMTVENTDTTTATPPITPPTSSNQKEALSEGAIGGIAAGVSTVALIVAFLLFRFWRNSYRKRTKATSLHQENTEKDTRKDPVYDIRHLSELPADEVVSVGMRTPDLSNHRRSELPVNERLSELPTDQEPHVHGEGPLHLGSTSPQGSRPFPPDGPWPFHNAKQGS